VRPLNWRKRPLVLSDIFKNLAAGSVKFLSFNNSKIMQEAFLLLDSLMKSI
jgi:hypothetical protein